MAGLLFQQIKKDLKKYSKIFEQKDRLSQSKASKVSLVPQREGRAGTSAAVAKAGPHQGCRRRCVCAQSCFCPEDTGSVSPLGGMQWGTGAGTGAWSCDLTAALWAGDSVGGRVSMREK